MYWMGFEKEIQDGNKICPGLEIKCEGDDDI